jgi:hypothetical protein
MKKSIAALALSVMLCFVCIISASAVSELSPDEALTRKRAYYAGINNSVALLSKNIGSLENVQIKRIIVLSPTDFTSEAAVKDAIISASQHLFSLSAFVTVYIQFSASDGATVQDYLFNHALASGSICTLSPLNSSDTNVGNYFTAVSSLSNPAYQIASGVAHTSRFYYLDIDLSDYQNSGYPLSVPLVTGIDESSALFPLMRMRAYYPEINNVISLLSQTTTSLKDIQIKRIIVRSSNDFTSTETVSENILAESQKDPLVYTITISVQFSASDGDSVDDYLFWHSPASSSYSWCPMFFPDAGISNYNDAITCLANYGTHIAPGIAKGSFGGSYYLDIDLNDYQSSGYSLAI